MRVSTCNFSFRGYEITSTEKPNFTFLKIFLRISLPVLRALEGCVLTFNEF